MTLKTYFEAGLTYRVTEPTDPKGLDIPAAWASNPFVIPAGRQHVHAPEAPVRRSKQRIEWEMDVSLYARLPK